MSALEAFHVADRFGWVVILQKPGDDIKCVTIGGMASNINIDSKKIEKHLATLNPIYRPGCDSVPFFRTEAEAQVYREWLEDLYLATYMVEANKDGRQ